MPVLLSFLESSLKERGRGHKKHQARVGGIAVYFQTQRMEVWVACNLHLHPLPASGLIKNFPLHTPNPLGCAR
jgi:hypothetical protein